MNAATSNASTIIKKLEDLINTLLRYDPHSLQQMVGFSGKVLLIDVQGFSYHIAFTPTATGVKLELLEEDNTFDVKITGSAMALLSLMISSQDEQTVFPKDLEVKGDIHLAQRLQSVIKQLNIEWEELFAEYMGDTLARKLMLFVRDGKQRVTETRQRLQRNTSEYLRFEQEVLPDQLLIDEFIQGVDQLRNDVERLKLRIERLSKLSTE